jgi:hypothetical protein
MLGCDSQLVQTIPSWFEAVGFDFLSTRHRALDYVT